VLVDEHHSAGVHQAVATSVQKSTNRSAGTCESQNPKKDDVVAPGRTPGEEVGRDVRRARRSLTGELDHLRRRVDAVSVSARSASSAVHTPVPQASFEDVAAGRHPVDHLSHPPVDLDAPSGTEVVLRARAR